ncbi:MAG: TonB family protein [Verrucomicrobiae bacterium]|nr:TonB family protein [Verrucomicrobiae bacterium]
MVTPFQRNLLWSTAIHIVALVILCFSMGFSSSPKKEEVIQFMDLAAMPGEAGGGDGVEAAAPLGKTPDAGVSPAPAPEPEPVAPQPQPVTPPPQPEPAPIPPDPTKEPPIEPVPVKTKPEKNKPEPKPAVTRKEPVKTVTPPATSKNSSSTEKPKIKISTTVVKKVLGKGSASTSSGSNSKGSNSPAGNPGGVKGGTGKFDSKSFGKGLIVRMGKNGAGRIWGPGGTGGGTSGSGKESPYAWYYGVVFKAMDDAWRAPSGVSEGLATTLILKIERSGRIAKVSLASSSGNPTLDESALTAARSVEKLQPLPGGMGDLNGVEITVEFKNQRK